MSERPKEIRVLGLHGMGTSAHIFKTQTVALRSKLPPHYTFKFIDAPFHCAPAPGTDILFESGHYAWWTHQTVNGIRGAHQFFEEYISSHGPFDILMGFSQGCSLISSYLLYHARETPDQPLPFKAAVFICGGMPFRALEDLGVTIPDRANAINELTSKLMSKKAGALVDLAAHLDRIRPGVGLWDNLEGLLHNPDRMPDETDVFGLDFTAMPPDLRIGIPTAHIFGAKDPRWPASLQLAHFCDDRRLYDHRGGHDIPRSTEVSVRIAGLIEELGREIQNS